MAYRAKGFLSPKSKAEEVMNGRTDRERELLREEAARRGITEKAQPARFWRLWVDVDLLTKWDGCAWSVAVEKGLRGLPITDTEGA